MKLKFWQRHQPIATPTNRGPENAKTSHSVAHIQNSEDTRTFQERTRLTGIAPPQNLAKTVTSHRRVPPPQTDSLDIARVFTWLSFLILPLSAGGVFAYLQFSQSENPIAIEELPSTDTPRPKIPKRMKPTATPVPMSTNTPAKLPEVKIIRVSKAPAAPEAPQAIARGGMGITLSRDESLSLQRTLLSNLSARKRAAVWRDDNRRLLEVGTRTMKSLVPTEISDKELLDAHTDLARIKSLMMTVVGVGEVSLEPRIRQLIIDWARELKPSGNAMVEWRLLPLIEAFSATSYRFSDEDRSRIDEWLLLLADTQISHALTRGTTNDFWFTQHLRFVAAVGFATGNGNLQHYVRLNAPIHLFQTIKDNGETTTYADTKDLTRHVQHVGALLHLSLHLYRAGMADGDSLPNANSPLGKAIQITLPLVEAALIATPQSLPSAQATSQQESPVKNTFLEATAFAEGLEFFMPIRARSLISRIYGNTDNPFPTDDSLLISVMNKPQSQLFEQGPTNLLPQAQPPAAPPQRSAKP